MVFLATDHDEASAIEALTHDSDRAAAILACTLLEARLKRTIMSHLHKDEKITRDMFKVTGALGNFGTQVNLGFLIGIYAEPFRKELETIKEIRNDFAHKANVTSFKNARISSLAMNLKILEHFVLGVRHDGFVGAEFTYTGYGPRRITIHSLNRGKLLNDPRERYVTTCQVLAHLLAALHEAPITLREPTL